MKQTERISVFDENDALAHFDAVGLHKCLKNKTVSIEELQTAARKRSLKANHAIHAVAFTSSKSDLPKFSDNLVFSGIPTFIKDNIDVKGLPTGYGSNAFKPATATQHSDYTKQLATLGLNIIGKSTLPEFGLNATTEPSHTDATKNPWNLEHSAGASSGGAAALVASGVVPIAHGNDGGGSIRIPASWCGLVGLKPSRNRHINEKLTKGMPINIVSEGILSRSVRDTAHFHFALEGHYQNSKLPPLPLITNAGKRRLKIGYYLDSVTGFSTDTETRNAIHHTSQLLNDMGHHVEEMKFPVSARFAEDFALYWGLLAYALSKTAKFTINRTFNPNKLDGLSQGLANHYKKNMLSTPFFIKRLQNEAAAFRHKFSQYDVFLSPVLGQIPRPLGELHPDTEFEVLIERLSRYASFTPMANIAGTPAISLPLGMSQCGLPIGVQFGADIGQEQTLIELAYELEDAAPWQHLYNIK